MGSRERSAPHCMGAYVLLKVSDQSLDKSPFFDAAHKAGASQYIVLNHMLMPYGYGDVVEEYWSLVRDVTLWDVATERQVEVAGRDAPRFIDLIVARNLEKLSPGQCRYVVMTDETGAIINDPVIARLEANLYWTWRFASPTSRRSRSKWRRHVRSSAVHGGENEARLNCDQQCVTAIAHLT